MSETLLRTPLFEEHQKLGAKMVPFAGWQMPVEYPEGLRKEHTNCRQSVGLFDVSHMGEIKVSGIDSVAFLQKLLSNDIAKCKEGQAQYNIMCNEKGGVIDDLIIYCLKKDEDYLLVVNASNKDKDWAWIQKQAQGFSSLDLEDQSLAWAQIAVQGPKAVDLVAQIFPDSSEVKKFRFAQMDYEQTSWIVSRTGYTGEDGFEIYGSPEKAAKLWANLVEKGKDFGLLPCGLGARNTLRIEAALPLYGNEFLEDKAPWGVGMDWALKLKKEAPFIGKEALVQEKAKNQSQLVGLKALEKAIPREGYAVLSFDREPIGHVTSGTFSPSLEAPIAMALVHKDYDLSQGCFIEVRKRVVEAQAVDLPFIKKA